MQERVKHKLVWKMNRTGRSGSKWRKDGVKRVIWKKGWSVELKKGMVELVSEDGNADEYFKRQKKGNDTLWRDTHGHFCLQQQQRLPERYVNNMFYHLWDCQRINYHHKLKKRYFHISEIRCICMTQALWFSFEVSDSDQRWAGEAQCKWGFLVCRNLKIMIGWIQDMDRPQTDFHKKKTCYYTAKGMLFQHWSWKSKIMLIFIWFN